VLTNKPIRSRVPLAEQPYLTDGHFRFEIFGHSIEYRAPIWMGCGDLALD
jgi:hypothetical protein